MKYYYFFLPNTTPESRSNNPGGESAPMYTPRRTNEPPNNRVLVMGSPRMILDEINGNGIGNYGREIVSDLFNKKKGD